MLRDFGSTQNLNISFYEYSDRGEAFLYLYKSGVKCDSFHLKPVQYYVSEKVFGGKSFLLLTFSKHPGTGITYSVNYIFCIKNSKIVCSLTLTNYYYSVWNEITSDAVIEEEMQMLSITSTGTFNNISLMIKDSSYYTSNIHPTKNRKFIKKYPLSFNTNSCVFYNADTVLDGKIKFLNALDSFSYSKKIHQQKIPEIKIDADYYYYFDKKWMCRYDKLNVFLYIL